MTKNESKIPLVIRLTMVIELAQKSQTYSQASQAWAQTHAQASQAHAQACAQGYQTHAQESQANAQASQAWSQASQAWSQAKDAWNHAIQNQTSQAWSQASQAWAQAQAQESQAKAQASQASVQTSQYNVQKFQANSRRRFRTHAQASQAHAQASQAWSQASQAWSQASQAWSQAKDAWNHAIQNQTSQAFAQASQAWAQAQAQESQANAQASQAWAQASQAHAQTHAQESQAKAQAQAQAHAQASQANAQESQAWVQVTQTLEIKAQSIQIQIDIKEMLTTKNISSADLLQILKSHHNADSNLTDWKDYLEATSLTDLETKKKNLTDAIQTLENQILEQAIDKTIAKIKRYWKKRTLADKINGQLITEVLTENWQAEIKSKTDQETIKVQQIYYQNLIDKAQAHFLLKDEFEVLKTKEAKLNSIEQTLDIYNSDDEISQSKLNTYKNTSQKSDDKLLNLKLSDYTLLTQKSTERKSDNKGTKVIFNETFQTETGEKNYSIVYDSANEDVKEWVINQPKVWISNDFFQEWSSRIKKEYLVDPNSFLFTYLNKLQELEVEKSKNLHLNQELNQLLSDQQIKNSLQESITSRKNTFELADTKTQQEWKQKIQQHETKIQQIDNFLKK